MAGEEQRTLGSGGGLDPADLGAPADSGGGLAPADPGVPAGSGGDADLGDAGTGVSDLGDAGAGVSVDSGGDADFGGDAACWLGQLCPECGAVPEGEGAQDPTVPCWRCGAVRAQHPEGG